MANRIKLGGDGSNGELTIFRKNAPTTKRIHSTILANGQRGNLRLGGNGTNGDLAVFTAEVTGQDLYKYSKAAVWIDGSKGDIKLRGADCAEEFDADPGLEKGMVAVLSETGRLRACGEAYDRRVVGVVSGSAPYHPALILDRRGGPGRVPIALLGKVVCLADATECPIRAGDLLTTSSVAGHARVAADPSRAFGAVLGKALASLDSGLGSVPVLVGRS